MRLISKIAFAVIVLALAPTSLSFADPPPNRRYEPGETFKDCPECPEMLVVPAGSFIMGSPESEEGRTRFEGPQHRVTFFRRSRQVLRDLRRVGRLCRRRRV